MMLTRRDPFNVLFHEAARVQGEMDRLFGRTEGVAGPRVNLWQDADAFYAEVDLPGVDPAKVDVTVSEGNRLTVAGERPATDVPNAVWHRHERRAGAFSRTLTLPVLVDAARVEARYEQGVLRLTLPKSEAAKPRKIAVTGA